LLADPEFQVNLGDRDGRTALHLAAAHGEHQLTKMLLAHQNTTPGISDASGDTPLHVAIRGRYNCITVALVEAGAGVGHRNADGATPLLLA
ncbi:ankyrin repeat-containing domain protein, partial [Tuber indicum]